MADFQSIPLSPDGQMAAQHRSSFSKPISSSPSPSTIPLDRHHQPVTIDQMMSSSNTTGDGSFPNHNNELPRQNIMNGTENIFEIEVCYLSFLI